MVTMWDLQPGQENIRSEEYCGDAATVWLLHALLEMQHVHIFLFQTLDYAMPYLQSSFSAGGTLLECQGSLKQDLPHKVFANVLPVYVYGQ